MFKLFSFLVCRSGIFIFENLDSPILESCQNYVMYHIYNITKLRIPHKSFLILGVPSHYSIHPLRLILLHQTGPRYVQLYLAYLESQDTVISHRYFQLFLAYLESQDWPAPEVTIHIYSTSPVLILTLISHHDLDPLFMFTFCAFNSNQ